MSKQAEEREIHPDILRHLELLFDDAEAGLVEIAWVKPGAGAGGRHFAVDDLYGAADYAVRMNAQGRNVYVGAALRRDDTDVDSRGGDDSYLQTTHVYVDLDDAAAVDQWQAKTAHCPPTIAVRTGMLPHQRIQLWWRVEPFSDPELHRALCGGLSDALDGDRKVVNPSRIMRLAGTIAWPAKKGRVKEQTALVRGDASPTYTTKAIAAAYPVDEEKVVNMGADDGPEVHVNSEGKVDDGREQIMRDTVMRHLRALVVALGRWPSAAELFEAAWPDYAAKVDLSKPGRGRKEMEAKCEAAVRRAKAGKFGTFEAFAEEAEARRTSTADDFDDVSEEEAASGAPGRFTLHPVSAYANAAVPPWLIKNLLPMADIGMVFGPSKSGKSFVMIDMAMALARGIPWLGEKTKRCRVVYICAEGAGGFRKRLKAYAKAHEVDLAELDDWFRVLPNRPNLHRDNEDVVEVIKAIKAWGACDVIIVDTLAQVSVGADENSGEDMGPVLDRIRKLGEKTGAMPIIVHHTGKDVARGARGWSGMLGALDAGFEVCMQEVEGGPKERWLELDKAKDSDDDKRWGMRLVVQQLGVDEDDDPITSCSVEFDVATSKGGKPRSEKEKPMGSWERMIMEAFGDLELVTEEVAISDLLAAAMELRGEHGWRARANCRRALDGLVRGKKLTRVGQIVTRAEGL